MGRLQDPVGQYQQLLVYIRVTGGQPKGGRRGTVGSTCYCNRSPVRHLLCVPGVKEDINNGPKCACRTQ